MVIIRGDTLTVLRGLPAGSVQCCLTSPPYYNLRDYQVSNQYGMERTPQRYLARMRAVCREVRRVLRDDGVFFLNIGDSFFGGGQGDYSKPGSKQRTNAGSMKKSGRPRPDGAWLQPKQLLMIPERLAILLQNDGWILRNHIVWHKPNSMPESVTDRCSTKWEHLFLFSKKPRYKFRLDRITLKHGVNPGDVWTIPTQPRREAHFATFPDALVERCLLAGSDPGDLVLDPFGGRGTTAIVAHRLNRRSLLIELNPEYAALAATNLRGLTMPIAFEEAT